MAKKHINKKEYTSLCGLLFIAKRHTDALKDIEESIKEIVDEEGDYGHSADAVYSGDPRPESLLYNLGLKVKK